MNLTGFLDHQTTTEMVKATWGLVKVLHLNDLVSVFVYALLGLFITTQALSAATSGRGEQLRELGMRTILAVGILAAVTPMQNAIYNTWLGAYKWSVDHATSATQNLREEAAQKIDDVWGTNNVGEAMLGAIDVIGSGGATGSDVRAAAGIGGTALLAGEIGLGPALDTAILIIRVLIIPIVAMFIVLIYGSAIIVMLAATALPFAAVMALRRSGLQYFNKVALAVVMAYASVVMLPVLYGVLTAIAVYAPMVHFLNALKGAMDSFVAAWHNANHTHGFNFLGLQGLAKKALAVANGLAQLLNILIGSLVFLGAGVIAGTVIVLKLENFIQHFIGGMTTGGADAKGARVGATQVRDHYTRKRDDAMKERAKANRGSGGGSGGAGSSEGAADEGGGGGSAGGAGPAYAPSDPSPAAAPETVRASSAESPSLDDIVLPPNEPTSGPAR